MKTLQLAFEKYIAITISALSLFVAIWARWDNWKLRWHLKHNEVLEFGTFEHPHTIVNTSHRESVICCRVVNRSIHTATIRDVKVFVDDCPISVTWSHAIDELGNPQAPHSLVGVDTSSDLYVRSNDGEPIRYARAVVVHSLRNSPCELEFDPTARWSELEHNEPRRSV